MKKSFIWGIVMIMLLASCLLMTKPIYADTDTATLNTALALEKLDKYSKFDKYVVAIGAKEYVLIDKDGKHVPSNTTGTARIIRKVYGAGVLIKKYKRRILVTAKHVVFANDGKGPVKPDLWIWGNKINGKEFEYPYQDFQGAWHKVKWIKHTDDKVDIAASVIGTAAKDLVDFVKLEEFKEISNLKKGEEIFYLGFPNSLGADYGSNPVLRKGIVALAEKGRDFFYMDAVVTKGNSGGPVFNLENELLGIVTDFKPQLTKKGFLHSGLGRVFSADCIKELLDSPEFQDTIVP